jgi:hypothetical protein
MNSHEIMRQYLERVGQLPGATEAVDAAGAGVKPRSEEEVRFLRSTIQGQVQINRLALLVALSLICVTFIAAVIVSAFNHDSLTIVISVTGIGSASQVGLFAWLRSLWKDSNFYAVLLVAADQLSPQELMKLVAGLYFGGKNLKMGQPNNKKTVGIKSKPTTR